MLIQREREEGKFFDLFVMLKPFSKTHLLSWYRLVKIYVMFLFLATKGIAYSLGHAYETLPLKTT